MLRRILILSSSVGAGHRRAAEAVEAAARELDSSAVVKHLDVLSLTNAMFRRMYGSAYLDLVNKLPHALDTFTISWIRSLRQATKRTAYATWWNDSTLGSFCGFCETKPGMS